ncbi:fungal specific transcription factor [Colletotrichum paranaense]|uniref:Fungal specific transcription factor n=1 Tax=Colletotrichum paranaense TaxID=1914294 RepID=A0ABQ9SNQ9_9PEZI|nr:fungal specific transcription factor [Colletotrichum paranaense]KAK1540879.1 fungal specific transcription factor [Colletotrichum paranaense]
MDARHHEETRVRRRRALACIECRKRKLRCDHNRPCSKCQRAKNRTCVYPANAPLASPENHINYRQGSLSNIQQRQSDPEHGMLAQTPQPADRDRVFTSSTDGTWHSSSFGSVLLSQISTPGTVFPLAMTGTSTRRPAPEPLYPAEKSPTICSLTELTSLPTIMIVKSRYISPSHWLYSVMLMLPALKWLDKEMVKQEEYRASVNHECIVRLQLCFALGALTYDDLFSLRPYALQWIYETQSWLTNAEKSQPSISGIQIMCLLQLAQQTTESLYGDRISALSGNLLRSAICIGLHRDPIGLPRMLPFQIEIRRRLWTTVLELVLEASIESGQPVLISSEDFDCSLPSNLNDDQLHCESTVRPIPKNPSLHTDSSLQIALGQSLTLRLTIAKLWNKVKQEANYATVLQLGLQLTATRQILTTTLKNLGKNTSLLTCHMCEMVLMRYVFALHLPYMLLPDSVFSHSRRECIDAALHLTYRTMPVSDTNESLSELLQQANDEDYCPEFGRLIVCGSGSLRSAQHIAISVIAADLNTMISERGKIATGSALRVVEERWLLKAGVAWARRRIEAGQENVKDYVFFAIVLAATEAVLKGKPVEDEMTERCKEAIADAKTLLSDMTGGTTFEPASAVQNAECDNYLEDIGAFWASDLPSLDWGGFMPMPHS